MCYMTIPQAGKLEGIPNARILRQMEKRGELPGYRAGSRFYINVERLREQIELPGKVGGCG